jgi:hypothetical protein
MMSVLLGYHPWGLSEFSDDSTPITNIKYGEFSAVVIDELSLRGKAESTANVKENHWDQFSKLLAKFQDTLEAGNILNEGVKIVSFKVMRRESNSNNDIYLGEVPLSSTTGNIDLEFEDVTQPNADLVYSIIPIGENGLDGTLREVSVSSDFAGVWVVDKDSKQVLAFDKAIGSVSTVDSTLNINRTQIDTFNQYPQFYYGQQKYETFTLSTVILPDDGERTSKKYKEIISNFIVDHKPKIVKTDNGKILVADISNLRASAPLNTWENYDFINIQVDVTECADYEDFMRGE